MNEFTCFYHIKNKSLKLSRLASRYLAWAVPVAFLSLTACMHQGDNKKNLLLICVDDLRPELACYGNNDIQSPHLDLLASQGLRFNFHYANVPTCGASRYSLLTGLLPRNPAQVGNEAIRKSTSDPWYESLKAGTTAAAGQNPESFIHQLRKNGWYTAGMGKISHYSDGFLYGYNQAQGTDHELPKSWDQWMLETGQWDTGWDAFFGYADGSNRNGLKNQVKPYECADVADTVYPDGLMARRAVEWLRSYAGVGKDDDPGLSGNSMRPFVLAVGFFRPHLPFNAPKKYWDLYDEDSLPLTPVPGLPDGVNPASLHNSGEFNSYRLGDEAASLETPLSDAYARKLRHAYFAAISYVDAQIGRVLDELERLGLDDNTVIVVWGDHGWHLGDMRVWGKHTLFEWALRSTLIICDPGSPAGVTDQIVSTVDIYPTLMELLGVDMPYEGDGRSLVPLIENPQLQDWNGQALGFYNRGVSIRTDRYRLNRYIREAQPATELFNQVADPWDSVNVAGQNPVVVDSLKGLSIAKKSYKIATGIWAKTKQ